MIMEDGAQFFYLIFLESLVCAWIWLSVFAQFEFINNQQSCEKQTKTILMIKAEDKIKFPKYEYKFYFSWPDRRRSSKSDKIVKI